MAFDKELPVLERIALLRDEIERLDNLYYNGDGSDVDDEVYDSLKRDLTELENSTFLSIQRSPVGAPPVSRFDKHTHPMPMLSLTNVFSLEDDEAPSSLWAGLPQRVTVEYKYDGVAIELIYQGGDLKLASTRGDGQEGDVVTDNVCEAAGVPISLDTRIDLIVRGEVIIPHAAFKRACERNAAAGRKVYANPRNMVSGLIRVKDPRGLQASGMVFIAYEFIDPASETSIPLTEIREPLSSQFNVSEILLECLTTDSNKLSGIVDTVSRNRSNIPFDIDGLVIKLADSRARQGLGSSRSSPNWAVAYKFPAQTATSVLESVKFQVGRTGVITPVAKIAPVRLAGVTISSVTLHNFDEISRLDLHIGDTVVISRRGDVIPKVERVIESLRTHYCKPIELPSECPACSSGIERAEGKVEYFCINDTCPSKVIGRLKYFVSRDGLDIKNLGDAAVEALVAAGSIASFSSIFHIGMDDLVAAGIGTANGEKILLSIDARRESPFYKVLRAVGIPEVGDSTARLLANRYESFNALGQATEQELQLLDDIGPVVAKAIVDYIAENYRDLVALDLIITYTKTNKPDVANQDLVGKTVVVTGSSFNGRSRRDVEEEVISRGARLSKSVSKMTDLVYVGLNAGPEKLNKLVEYGFIEDGIVWKNPRK